MMTVSSQLTNGVLDIDFDANKDEAIVAVIGSQLNVTSGGNSRSFVLTDIRSIDVNSLFGQDQSISFGGNVSIPQVLGVRGIQSVNFANGNYRVGSASVVSPGSIEFNSFSLNSDGNIVLTASKTLTSTETGLLGFLGVVSKADTAIRINNSSITGAQIDMLARTDLSANADGDSSDDVNRDFARVKSVGNATIDVLGVSNIVSRGSLSMLADSLQRINATAIATPTGSTTSRDAALALTNASSTATIGLTGQSRISAIGNASIDAHNSVSVLTRADGSLALANGKGGIVALAEYNGVTTVLVGDTVSVAAANLNINATSDATLTTTAKSTVGGATDNDQSTKDDLNASGAATAEGGLGLAAAFARSKSNQTTSVTIQGEVSLTALGVINLKSDESTTKTTTADGSATNNAGTTGSGVGVSIAADRSEAVNRVLIAGKPTLATPQFNVSSVSASGENHTTTATSGAGASNVGFAGGFASTNVLTSAEAIIADNANLNAGGAAISLTANSIPTLNTEAKPVGTTNIAAKKGVGASIARTKMVNTTRANVGSAATITNAKSLTANANAIDNITTNAVTGGTGGTAVTAGVATAVIDSTVTATLGQGPSTTFAGPVSLNANHGGNISTTVAGDVLAEKAAIGGSFALNDVDVNAIASIERSLTATGDVSAKSQASGSVKAESKASTKGTGETTKTSDQQTAEQQAAIGSDKEAPSADAKGKVSASAAAAINLVDVHAKAFVAASKSVATAGKVAIVASNSVDVSAKSDAIAVGSGTTTGGTATGGTEFGVGVAVAINLAKVSAESNIGTGANVNASGGLLLDANSTIGEDTARLFSAESISGAGARKTGFAGSFAINKVLNTSSSAIADSSTINVGVNDLSVLSTNTATNSVNATPSPDNPATGGKRGIGTSFALNIAENSTISDVSANTILNSTPVAGSTQRSNVTAISVQTASTVAKAAAGSEETPGSKSLTPVFAIQAVTNTTNAKLDSDAASIRGNLQVLANLTATNTINAEGSSIATETARGLTLALDIGDNQTNATVGGHVVTGNAMLVNAKANVTQAILAKASSKGGDTTPTVGGADKETADAKNAALAAGAKDNGEETPELKTPTGPVSFAAAIAIGLSRTNTTATLADGSNIDAGGKLTVSSSADVDSSVISNASALTVSAAQEETDGTPPEDPPANDASGRGVGVAIAVNVNRVNTLSSIGIGDQVQSEGLTVSAGNSLRDRHTFHTEAASGAGGGEVGTAGSFAINVIRNTTDARIHAADVDAGQGQVEVLATNKANSTNVSKPSSNATGSKRGRGASFAVNVTRNTTTAEIEDNVLLRKNGTISDSGAANVSVKATSDHNTTTDALGGAGSEDELGESAATGVFALNLAVNTTTARASGSETGNSHASGNVTVEATHSGTTATKAEGASRAEDTNVGIVLGLGFSRDLVTSELDGGWIVDGSVSTKSSNDATSSSDSKASARGGEADKESEKAGKLGDVEVKTSESKNILEETDGQAIEEETPKPKTPDASLGFAGALAINVATAKSTARIGSKARLVAAGAVQLESIGQANVNSTADASAVVIPGNEVNDAQNAPPKSGNTPPVKPKPSQTGVGVAIDVNVANVRTEATVSGNAKITAASLSLDAGTASNGNEDHVFSSKAVSGTGVDKVGFAGSLAINVITNDSTADIGSNAEINLLESTDPDLAGTSKDLTLKSRNETSSTVDSVASVAGSPKTGIGPSIATNVSRNSSNASVADSVVFLASVDDYTVDAVGNYTMNTKASSGSTAKATLSGEGGLAISPALSVASNKNSTTAVGSEGSVFQSLNVLGNLNVRATHVSNTDGQAEAKVNATGKAAIGIPIVVNVLRDNVSASSKGDFTVAGSADVRATSDIQVDGDATASVAGARSGTGGAAGLKQRAQEYVDGFRRDEGEKVVKIADRLDERLTEAGDMIDQLTTAKMQTTGVAASGVANVVLSDTTAEVNGTILATGAVNVIAEGDRDITADVSGLAVSPTFAEAYGGALAINIAEQTFTARAFTDNGLAGESITVRAGSLTGNSHLVKTRALAGGGAKDDAVAGSIGVNIVADKIAASIGQSPIENGVLTMNVQAAKGITIRSQSDLEIQNIAGAAAIGIQGDGVGGALAVNSIRNATQSLTGASTTIVTGGKLSVTASSNIEPTKGDVTGNPIALAAGGSGGGDQARAGSLAANVLHEKTLAELGADNAITTTQIVGPRGTVVPGDVVVDSLSSTELRTGAGAIAIGLKLGQSVGVAANIINKDIDSHIGTGTTMNAQGKVDVVSTSSEDTFSIAAAPGLGGSVNKPTFGGAIQLTSQVVNVRAIVDENANLNVRDDVRVESEHQVDADVITGSIAAGQNNSVAGSLTIVSLLDRTEAMIAANATVTVAGVIGLTVKATSNENVLPVAIGGSGAGDNANAGSITLTRIHETTLAHIDDGATVNAHNTTSAGTIKPSILVLAEDNTVLNNAAGVATVGGKKGQGGSLDATKIDKNTTAFVAGGAHLDSDKNITVSAKSTEDVLSVVASIAVSGQTSIMGSLSGYGVDVTTRAILGDNPLDLLEPLTPAVVHAAGSVVVTADDKNEMDFIGGGVSASGGTAVGGAASVAVVRKTTEAIIAPTAQVSADALAAVEAVNVNNGRFNIAFPDVAFDSGRVQPPTFPLRDSDGDGQTDLDDSSILRPRVVTNATETRRGVVVAATNRDDIAAIVAGGGIGNGFTFGVSTPAAILRVDTTARIADNAQINIGNQNTAGSTQSVLVAAASDYSHLSLSGALAVSGGGAIAPAGNIESTRINTIAAIGANADVATKRDVEVQANATEDSLLITASGSATGSGGGNGSIAVFALNNQTHAYIGAGADVDAGGNVVVSASDVSDLDSIAGAATISGAAGVSVSLGVNVIHKDTQAFIANDASVDAKANSTDVTVLSDVGTTALTTTTTRGVVVQAYSKESLLDIAASGSVSGGVGGAGGINVNVIDSDTSAFIGDRADINTNATGENALQSVHVIAGNELDARSIAGGLAIGSIALAGSVDIGVVRSDTTSFVGQGATLNAVNDIVVESLAKEEIDSLGVSGGFAAGTSFAGAVAVWALGTKFDATYSDDSTTTNSLSQNGSTVDQQAANSAARVASILSSGLSNFSGVDGGAPADATPKSQIADILRQGKTSIDQGLNRSQITTELFDSSDATGTIAEVREGAILAAGDDIEIEATTKVDLNAIAGSVSGSAIAAVGASVTVERVHIKTDAFFAGTIQDADQVSIQSNFNNNVEGTSLAGQGALFGALGAAVTSIRDDSSTTARVDGSPTTKASIQQAAALSIDATSSTNLEGSTGQGALAIGGAAGVTVTKVVADGKTSALVGDNVNVGGQPGKTVASLTVDANATTTATSHAFALAAGVGGAATLNFATAEVTPAIEASLGSRTVASNSNIVVNGNVDVKAISNSDANADLFGLQLAAGAALGFSRAKATVASDVDAAIGRNTTIDAGGSVAILAQHNKPSVLTLPNGSTRTITRGADAQAEAGALAAIAGNTARAFSISSPSVEAVVFDEASITSDAAVTVISDSTNNASSTGGSLTLGLAGAGGVETTADIDGIASAVLRNNAMINATSLDVRSMTNDRAISEGRAATGGILSGNATTASASIKNARTAPNSSVSVLGSTINVTDSVRIIADQEADADAFAKGTSIGGILAAGKSDASVVVTPSVKADVASSTIVAGGIVDIGANFGDGSAPSVTARNIEEAEALAADEVSTAFAKGSGGALIGLVGSSATSIYKPEANTEVGPAVSITGLNVTISSEADSGTAAIARNVAVGFVARGKADTRVDMKNTVAAEVVGGPEFSETHIDAANNFTLRVDSSQKGDAFSHSRAIDGVSIGDANSTILGDYDLNASVGTNVDVAAGGVIHIESEIDDANFGSQQTNDPRDPSERFGANAQADTGGIVADSHANAITRLGTAAIPAQSLVSVGRFSSLRAPTVELISDVTDIHVQSDANARAAGAAVIVASNSTGELHSDSKVLLSGGSLIDATTTTLESLQGTGSQLRMEVESTTDKDGLFGDPASLVTIRQDSLSKIEASDGASIRTRNLTVRADTDVSEFKATSLENGLVRSGSGGVIQSFDRDRNIVWNADVYLKGAPSPKLTVEANGATGATVTEAVGVTIVDTDGNPNNPFDTGTIGNVAAPTIVVNPINNASAYGNILFEIPLINAGEDASMTGRNGTFTVDRAFDEVIIQNNSNKPLQVGNINVINLGTPTVVIDVPISNTLAFDVFQDFGDTNLSIKNTTRSGTPSITLSGVISNPVGETTIDSAGDILRTNSGTVKIVTNVADLTARTGNVGSVASRIPIELIVSEGRQEDLNTSASGSVALDLIARIRQPGTSSPVSIDASNIVATNSTANILLHSSVQEIQEPSVLPLLRVNEIKQNDITFVEAHFEAVEEFPVFDLGVLGTSQIVLPLASNWNFDLVKGSSVAINLAELAGPNMGITSGTDVGSGAIDVATNGDISLSETTGPMRIGAVTTTRGNVTLNSNNSIVVSPTDAAADIVGTIVNLNVAIAIGTATAPVDVDSTSRLNATATGDVFLVETNGNMNIGAVTSSGGNVTLTATAGSILDAAADPEADVVGNSITLTANNATNIPAPTIGTPTDALELNSAIAAPGSVRAISRGSLFVAETSGSMTLAEARSTTGNIRVDVPDTAAPGSDLILTAAQVVAPAGTVQLNAGDNFSSTIGTLVQGTAVTVNADFGNADPGVGSTIDAAGTYIGRPITFSTGTDADTISLSQTSLQGPTTVNANSGPDTINVDRIAPLTTSIGGVRDRLTLNIGSGANQVNATATPTGNYAADIVGGVRGSGFNTLTVNGTSGNDAMALTPSQFTVVHTGAPTTVELFTLGTSIDQVAAVGGEGNDNLGIDLASGYLTLQNGVSFVGGNGTDSILVSGSTSADTFEVDATSAASGEIRTQVAAGPFSAPTTLIGVEQVTINGLAPTTNPGDTLRILDSFVGLPVVPKGSFVTPLPVTYTNIEQLVLGSLPVAVNDQVTTTEDVAISLNPFTNDSGLTDLPLTIVFVQSANGNVVYRDNGTPTLLSDDTFLFTPRANFSGNTQFQYTVRDANNDQSTATVAVTVNPVTDAPIVTTANVIGLEGTPIQLVVSASLADTDGSESLDVLIHNVPSIASFVNASNVAIGVDLGGGNWRINASDLSKLFIVVRDNLKFDLTLEAIATETASRVSVSRSSTFTVEVQNVAPQATIMTAPDKGTPGQPVAVQMAATDKSSIDQTSGFRYRVNWGDGSAPEIVQGIVTPTLNHVYANSGNYTITIAATDKDGAEGGIATHQIRISRTGLVPDPLNPGRTMLVVEGTSQNDSIEIETSERGRDDVLDLYFNGVRTESFAMPTSRIVVYGQAGDDEIRVDDDVELDTWMFGGFGNDTLIGGSGNSILVGGTGDDLLRGRSGEDILIGGRDRDLLFGGDDDNILIAGYSEMENDEAMLLDIQREWTSNGSMKNRIEHLRGDKAGGLNGSTLLRSETSPRNTFDDAAVDRLFNDKNNDWIFVNSDVGIRDSFGQAKYQDELDPVTAASLAQRTSASGESEETPLEQSPVEALSESPFYSEKFLFDTNGDGSISPLDVLTIINRLNQNGAGVNVGNGVEEDTQSNDFLDANVDGSVSPLDVLVLINYLNSRSQSGEGESTGSGALSPLMEDELMRIKKRLGR